MTYRIPPHNIDAENCILSSLLLDQEAINEVTARPEYFYKPCNQIIFAAIITLHNKNMPVDSVSVADFLKKTGNLENAGGYTNISKLIDYPISANIEYHSGLIKQKYDLRRLIEISRNVIEQSYAEAENPVEIIEKSQREIMEIGQDITGTTSVSCVIRSVVEKLEMLRDNPSQLSGLPTGFRVLDFHLSGLHDSDLILLGARPAMGKTALALNICKNIAESGYPVLIFSIEMSKEQLGQRLMADDARINLTKIISGKLKQEDWESINNSASIIYDLPIHIEDKAGITVEEMLSIARKMKMKHGIRFVCVDYIQLIKGWNRDGQGSKADISRSLKLMAKTLDIPVLALSQLNRDLEKRSDKRPLVSDLRESGSLEQDADIITFLYRDEVYNDDENNPNKGKAEVILRKNRQGTIGTVFLTWLGEYQRFENMAHGN